MRQLVLSGLLLAIIAGCQRTPAPSIQPESDTPPPAIPKTSAATVSQMPPPVAAREEAPPAPLPEGTDVTYQCVDGNEITVTYTYVNARLRWPDGRKLNLSRTLSSAKDGDVYASSNASLQHDGAVMRLAQNGGAAVTCSEESSSA